MITSLDNKKVKEWTKLHQKKYRINSYLLLNEELVFAAKENNYLNTLIYVGDVPFEFNEAYEVSQEVMDKISKKEGLSFIGIGRMIENKNNYQKRVIILDELQDPLNIGRIMDNAYAFRFDSVILSNNSADFYNEKALEASRGALYKLNINRCDIKKEIEELKKDGFVVYSTGLKGNTKSLKEIEPQERMAFVLGNEGSGVEEDVFDISDEIVKIDMEHIDSLNVAMAGAIVMYRFQ